MILLHRGQRKYWKIFSTCLGAEWGENNDVGQGRGRRHQPIITAYTSNDVKNARY